MIEWSTATIKAFRRTLLHWYDEEGRALPWRQDTDPYHVWISEIMLQQTQVQTVIPYYQRFMAALPTVYELADVSEDVLLKLWQGLGYYSRARHLKQAAQQVVQDYHGRFPTTATELATLSGIGPYTAGAIASIAFKEVVPAVDGNAFRVFSRLLEIDEDIARPGARKVFEKIIQPIVDPDRPGDFNQAIMDLGSSYMTATHSDPAHSPVKAFDQSYQDHRVDEFPVKTKKPRPVPIDYTAVILLDEGQLLMQRRSSKQLLAGYWTVPLIPTADLIDPSASPKQTDLATALAHKFLTDYQLPVQVSPVDQPLITQTYTHQKWRVTLFQASVTGKPTLTFFPGEWVSLADLQQRPMPKVQEKINQALQLGTMT